MEFLPPSLRYALSPAGCPFGDGLRTERVGQIGAVAARNRPQQSRCRFSLNSATRWPKDGGKRIISALIKERIFALFSWI